MTDLKPGDVCVLSSECFVSKMINAIQRFWSQDNKSQYSHAGIILNPMGEIYEAGDEGVHQGSLYDYAGKPALIARHGDMEITLFQRAFVDVQADHDGNPYPVHRLLYHLFPPLAKYWGTGHAVCSELVAQFLYNAGIMSYWQGVNPDELADVCRHWKGFEIVFEGKLPKKEN